jgi:hypothetical protein
MRGVYDHAFTLEALMKKHPELRVAFLDIKSAFDTVHIPKLLEKLAGRLHPHDRHLVEIVSQLISKSTLQVKISAEITNGTIPTSFTATTGVPQGSILSPTLFAVFIDDIADDLLSALPASSIPSLGDALIPALLYADDIALVATSDDIMQKALDICHAHSMANFYRFSPSKCVLMNTRVNLNLGGEALVSTTSFKYLGIWFSGQGVDHRRHAAEMVGSAWKAYFTATSCGLRSMSPATRLVHYVTFVRPIIEYGLPVISYPKSSLKILEQCQSALLRLVLGVGRNAAKDAMRLVCGVEELSSRSAALKFNFWNHLNCIGPSVLSSAVIQDSSRPVVKLCLSLEAAGIIPETAATATASDMEEISQPGSSKLTKSARALVSAPIQGLPTRGPDKCILLPPSVARLWIRWRVGVFFGKPRPCPRCNLANAKKDHIFACYGWNSSLGPGVHSLDEAMNLVNREPDEARQSYLAKSITGLLTELAHALR